MLEVIGADVPRVVSQMEEFCFIHAVFLSGKDGAAILWGLGVAAAALRSHLEEGIKLGRFVPSYCDLLVKVL